MSIYSDLAERLRALVLRRREEAELDEELRFHLEMQAAELEREGVPPAEARRLARTALGGVERTKEDVRDARGTRWLEDLLADARFAVRTLVKTPVLATALVFMLAVGIGASSTMFTLINAIVLRALPVPHPEELVAIGDPSMPRSSGRGVNTLAMSYPLYRDIRAHSTSLSGVLAAGPTGRLDVVVGANSEFEHPTGRFVSDNYFSVLGVPAAHGRVFAGAEDQLPGGSPVAVISDGWWTRRFNRSPSIVGTTLRVHGTRLTIIGVTPPSFSGEVVGQATDIWLPASMRDVLKPRDRALDDRGAIWLLLLGRLAPGRTVADVKAELEPFIIRTVAENAVGRDGADFLASKPRALIAPGGRGFSAVRDDFDAPLLTLLAGVLLLLVIICANIANLLLARAMSRAREMTVRLALGARRSRLVRMLLTESAVMGLVGGAAGLLVAYWGSQALVTLVAEGAVDVSLDARVLSFTLLLSLGTATAFGLAPALHASRTSTLNAGTRGSVGRGPGMPATRAGWRSGSVLVAAQVGLSIVLLVGAAMLTQSLRNTQSVDVGLDRDHLLMLDVDVGAANYDTRRLTTIAGEMRRKIGAIQGVRSVAYSENGIFSGTEWSSEVKIPGLTLDRAGERIGTDNVSAGYVATIGGRLLAGRDLETADEQHLPRVAVVNESFASSYFPGQSAVGRQFAIQDARPITIVGVVGDTRDHSLTATRRRAYFPYVAADTSFTNPTELRVAIRTSREPALLVDDVREAVAAIDPLLPIRGIDPLSSLMRESIKYERLTAQLASAFSLLAMLLASIGLYATMTYAVRRRTREIGLRSALGARPRDVLRLVLTGALRPVSAGMLGGIGFALAMGRVLQTQLYGVDTVDGPSILLAVGLLGASAAVATVVPALGATRVSPLEALRTE